MTDNARTNFYRTFAGNTTYVTGASIVSTVGLLGVQMVAARSLSEADFDLYVLAVTVAGFFLHLMDFGIHEGATHLIASNIGKGRPETAGPIMRRAFVWVALIGGAVSLLGVVASDRIARMLAHPDAGPLLAIVSLSILPWALARIVQSAFYGFQSMRFVFYGALLREPIKLAMFVGLVSVGLDVTRAVGAWSLSALAILLAHGVLFRVFARRQGIRLTGVRAPADLSLLGYSKYLYLPYISAWILPVLIRLIVARYSTDGSVGQIELALTITSLIMIFLMPVSQTLFPLVSQTHARNETLRGPVRVFTRLIGLAAFIVTALLFITGPWLLTAFYGPAYRDAAPYLMAAAAAIFLDSFKIVTTPLLKGSNEGRLLTWTDILRLALILAAGIPLTAIYGALGALFVLVGANLVAAGLQLWLVQRRLNIPCWRDAMPSLLWMVTMAGGYATGHPYMGLGLTGILVIWLQPLTKNDLQYVTGLVYSRFRKQ